MVDDFGAGHFGQDGTHDPPPPRLFPDPLAGLVTGEDPFREAPAPPPVAVAPPDPEATRRLVEQARRPVPRRPAPPRQSGVVPPRPAGHRSGFPRQPAHQSGHQFGHGAPVVHQPHAPTARGPQRPAPVGPKQEKSVRGTLIGCLVVLAALGGLLFNVLREIIEAVVDLFT